MEKLTGAEMISKEREEQIKKHGWTLENDEQYSEGQLIKAALFSINPSQFEWPYHWNEKFRDKIINKHNEVERLRVAGAFIAAEIDRLLNLK